MVVTPDGKYAFVAGFNFPDEAVPTHNHGNPLGDSAADYPAGSSIGIIINPFTNPQLVAGTRPIPAGFPQGLAISADGEYLSAAFPTIPLEDASGKQTGSGALFIFDIPAIEQVVQQSLGSSDLANLLARMGHR